MTKRMMPTLSLAPTPIHLPLLLLLLLLLPDNALGLVKGGGWCHRDVDCQLNGWCEKNRCRCHYGWTGRNCSVLDIVDSVSQWAYASNTTSSWGGRAVQIGGTSHAYIAEFLGCGMNVWGSGSRIVHLTRENGVGGGYQYADEALPVWTHNPDVINVNGTLVIFHIGDGTSGRYPNCSENGNGTTPFPPLKYAKTPPRPATYSPGMVHEATSPTGPWLLSNLTLRMNDTAVVPFKGCVNPASAVHPNGSVVLWCAPCGGCSSSCDCPDTGDVCECISNGTVPADYLFDLYVTEGGWGTPFRRVPRTVVRIPQYLYDPTFKLDDPTIWVSPQGYFHVLHHNGDGPAPCGWDNPVGRAFRHGNPHPVGCGVHLYSEDGHTWTFSPVAAYNATIITPDGASAPFYRQRPKVVQNEKGDITHLFTGNMFYPHPDAPSTANIRGNYNLDYSWTVVVETRP